MHPESLTGREIDGFIVEERIGLGGMAVVYRAFQPSINRSVALKIISLDSSLGEQDSFRRRFSQEAKVIASLEHIHILPIYDYGIVNNELAYLAMRLLRGGTLANELTGDSLDFDHAADLFTQIARGLHYAHMHGVVHRDLKPSNILLDEVGNAYLSDFGLAKLVANSLDLTKSGNIVGTPAYMSPEQLRGEAVDARSDIYSMGVILYHMLVGHPPFEASDSNVVAVIYQHLEKAPTPPHQLNPLVPPAVEAVVLRALQKQPQDRFETAEEMANALNAALGRRVSTANYPILRPSERSSKPSMQASHRIEWTERWNKPVMALAAALVVIAGLIGVLLLATRPTSLTFAPATVIPSEQAPASASEPTQAEIETARARLGADGFIAFITCNQTSEYHAAQAREIADFAGQYGLLLRVYDSDTDKYRQITQIERARTEGARAFIICPLDAGALNGALSSAQDAGIPLVLMSSGIESYGGVLLAGDDYLMGVEAGRAAGLLVRDTRDARANVVILDYPDLPIIVVRANGLEDGFREFVPEANIIGRYLGGTRENGEASIRTLLDQGIDFDVILSINDAGSFGAIAALEAAGIPANQVIVSSVDAEALAREYIRSGFFMRASVEVGRESFSRTAVNAAIKLLAGSTLPEIFLVPPGRAITRETLAIEFAQQNRSITVPLP